MEKVIFGSFLALSILLYDGLAIRRADRPAPETRLNAVVGLSASYITTDTLQLDKETKLVIDERLNLVKAQCTACHSSKLILQSHLTRDGWRQKIRWMQRTQKLWDLGESEPVVLDYLVKYYGPQDHSFDGRRLPLPKQKWN